MVLPKIIQIPCHHVLANQNSLKFKQEAPLKQIFNINLGIGIIKKLFFSYLRHISLCFYSNFDQESPLDAKLNSASNEYPLGILLMDPATPKTRNTWKKWNDDVIIPFFRVFLVFGVGRCVKSMPSGYSLDVEFNSASNELSQSKFE